MKFELIVFVLTIIMELCGIGGETRYIFSFSPEDDGISGRSFLMSRNRRWPNGIIPYEMDPTFAPKQRQMIEGIFQHFQSISCVKWVPRRNQNNFVAIIHHKNPAVCNSLVGLRGGEQDLNLGDNCFDVENGYQGAILHEMLHAVGFIHEQQRIDRDCYVSVLETAAITEPFDFGITRETALDFPYDFKSIMHYTESDKMRSLGGEDIGNFNGEMTELDIMKLNNMYCGGPTYCQKHSTECLKFKEAQKKCLVQSIKKPVYLYYK